VIYVLKGAFRIEKQLFIDVPLEGTYAISIKIEQGICFGGNSVMPDML
jgi:hypothetical protein